jgi:hypothetical protein
LIYLYGMFYRRKIILALLQVFGGRLEKINLQKLLLLLTSRQSTPEYDFVPYLYGCYSYSAGADLQTMVKKEQLGEDEISYHKKDKQDYLSTLKTEDHRHVHAIFSSFHRMDTSTLIRYTYVHYPYYAINSTIAQNILNQQEMAMVQAERPQENRRILFTIGYEGISLEAYLNKLIKHDIRVLVDVRNNPISQKFGFSKSSLKKYCESLNIAYLHFPEVGIQSEFRQELTTQKDYDNLFDKYKARTLPVTQSTQQTIFGLLEDKQRVALTCFEANSCQCHRKPLAEAISNLSGCTYELKHI